MENRNDVEIDHQADAAWVRKCVSQMVELQCFSAMDWCAQGLVRAALSRPPLADAWRHHETVKDARSGQWFFWRDPIKPDDWHVDEVCVENDVIVAKAGCGLDFFTECQPCRFVEGADEIIAALGR